MIWLAEFICRGRSQAVLVISVSALLSMVLPPLILLSGAALTLITLRNSLRVSLSVLSLAWLFSAIILWPIGIFAINYALLGFWLPVLISAYSLRCSNNLALSLLLVLLFMVAAVLVFIAVVPDPVALWKWVFVQLQTLPEMTLRFNLTQEQIELAAQQMTGYVASRILITLAACHLIGRWWQGSLINPGGFKREFSELRLGRVLSMVAVISIVVATILGSQLSIAISTILITVFLFQGLAVIHVFTAAQPTKRIWLIGLYVLLFLLPQLVVMVSLLGITDAWIDMRRRWLVKSID